MKISSYLEFKRDSAKGIFDHRKNPLLLIIDQQLQVYEKVEKVASNEFEEQIVVITILCACNNFLESKPHGSKRSLAVEKIKYQALYRLQEIDQLKDQHRVKAQKNWDKLRTIFKGKGARLGEEYWPETITPHFAGVHTSSAFKEWYTSTSDEDFITWLQSTYIPRELHSANNLNKITANSLLTKRVTYLDESERQIYKVTVINGLFQDHMGNIFDTATLQTNFSGKGWGIFVLSQTHELYVASHKIAELHHSSLSNGAPVLAAGEIAINQGKLVSMSPKSGHYKPDYDSIYRFLYWLSKKEVDLHGIPVITSIERNNKTYYDAYEVMLQGGKSDGLKAISEPKIKNALATMIKRPAPAPPTANNSPQTTPSGYLEPKSFTNPTPNLIHRPAPLPPITKNIKDNSGYLEPRPRYKPPIIKHYIAPTPPPDPRVIQAKKNNPDIEDIHFF